MIYTIVFLSLFFPIFMYLFQKAVFNYPLRALKKRYRKELKKVLDKKTINKKEIEFFYAISNNETYRNNLGHFLTQISCNNKVEAKKYYLKLKNHPTTLTDIEDDSLTSNY